MTLTGSQIERIAEAIQNAYSRDELRRVVLACMDKEFDGLVADKAYAAQVFDLVQWANRQSRAMDLLYCAYEHNRTNEALKMLWHEYMPKDGTPQLATNDIFLSFNHYDMTVAKRLSADLERAGFSVWTDGDLAPGTQNWQDAIEAAVEKCRCMVVVMTPHSKTSRWVRIEVDLAQELERPVIPVLADGQRREAVLLSLRDVQYVDLRREYAHAVQTQLVPAVQGILKSQPTYPSVPRIDVIAGKADAATSNPVTQSLPNLPMTAKVRDDAKIFRVQPLEIEWVEIPAGEFLMGSDKSKDELALENETPQHSVTLPKYHITKYPITNAQYLGFVNASGNIPPEHWKNGKIPRGFENHPVVHISWHDACAYCEWASSVAQFKIRLPTEAEWEKAARGRDGRIWPWGDQAPTRDLCNFARNEDGTTPVNKYPEGMTPYGAFDMAGNVWEWTNSEYRLYKYDPYDGRETSSRYASRTLRGGTWLDFERGVRCANRVVNRPDGSGSLIGFRLVSPE